MNRRDFVTNLAATASAIFVSPETPIAGNVADVLRLNAEFSEDQSLPKPKANYASELFDLQDIRLLDGPFKRQQEINRRYLLKLEPDRLLSLFRKEAGLDPKAPPYRGWESEPPNLNGHILGFYLSGTGMMVQTTGDGTLRERLIYIGDQLSEVQEANGSGYILPVPGGKKLFKEVAAGDFAITNAEAKYGYQINGVFEPTYTWNKVTLGLYEAYKATGYKKLRDVLIRTADWFGEDVLDKLSDEQVQKLLFCEHGSIHESMIDVYLLTHDAKYLNWARRLCADQMLLPLASGNVEYLNGCHANCSIPIFTGFERVYNYNGEQQLHTAAVNFLDEVIDHRSWVIGGNSAREHFFEPAYFEKALHAPAGPESCNSVNMLRLIESVYRTKPSAKLLDQYERILWNHLLAVHEPERGMISYYTPLAPGTYRVYSDEFDSMWCCVGTGMECPGKYAQMIYTRTPEDLTVDVNLFIASRLEWHQQDVVLRQETSFPDEESTTLIVEKSGNKKFRLRIRHPYWISVGAMAVTVNGTVVATKTAPGEFAELSRVWKSGDRIRVSLPMRVTSESLPNSERYVAFLYGPLVLSGELGTEGLNKLDFWQISTTVPVNLLREDEFPLLIRNSTVQDVAEHVERIDATNLVFEFKKGVTNSKKIQLVPFYRNHYQRYAIYWRTASS